MSPKGQELPLRTSLGFARNMLPMRMAEEFADHRQGHPARTEQRREGVAQVMDADGGQFGFRPDIFPKPLDVLKRLAFGLARKQPFAILRHT